jgi:glutamate carboxypeptidase
LQSIEQHEQKRIQQILSSREPELFALLEQLVVTQSGSHNKQGVDRVGEIIKKQLSDLPLSLRVVPQERLGDNLVFSTPVAAKGRVMLITGHMDTVFPEDTDFTAYREDETNVYGPGVIDMKGGLVVTMAAVRALAELDLLADIPLVLLFNSDEEIGSPESTPLVEELCSGARCGFVTECGGMQGEVVTGRRGKTGYRLEVEGRAGHAAFAGRDKASAILEICRQVIALEGLNDPDNCRVVNVGTIEGGIGPNTVPEHAAASIDTRFCTVQQGKELEALIDAIANNPATPGTRARLTVTGRRSVMEQSEANRALFRLVRSQAETLGLTICEEIRQGGSDASTIASQGVPVVDGLGPIGEFDHSEKEYMLRDSLVPRCCLLAASILAVHRLQPVF